MSVIRPVDAIPAEEQEAALLDRPLLPLVWWDWDKAALVALVALAALLRFWNLGDRALHHDESLHALYSWYLYVGRGYVHDPLMHGPFQFHAVAFIYFLLGASDYTARILPALLGTVTVALPYFLRDQLGRPGALFATALLAVSPSMLYYSRFVREDMYVTAWNLLLVVAMWRFMENGRRSSLVLCAAALSLAFSTKESTYLTVLIFGSYLFVRSLRELLTSARSWFDFRAVSHRAGLLITLVALTLPLGASSILLILERLGIDLVAWGAWQDPASPTIKLFLHAGSDPAKTFALVGISILGLSALAILLAQRWNWKLWLPAALTFYGIFIVLHTTFFTNMQGIGTGLWGGLEYWIAQQGVQRGSQPWYYYLVLLPIYEFLPIVFAIAGTVYFGVMKRFRDEFALFLVWWILGSFLLYSYAGEKMPWLSIHIALPIILLAGKALGTLAGALPWRLLRDRGGLYLVLLLPLIPLALRALVQAGGSVRSGLAQPAAPLLQALATAAAVAFLLGTARSLGKRMGLKLTGQATLLTTAILLGGFTLRAAWIASYVHGDIPVEMLVYTQTSPEVPRIMRQIDRIAAQTGLRENLPITVDSTDGFTWPWAWYLRDYKHVDYPALTSSTVEPQGTVLLLNANNQRAMAPLLSKYDPGQSFPHRWWFPEGYDLGVSRTPEIATLQERWDFLQKSMSAISADLLNFDNWGKKWRYFMYRDVGAPLGTADALVYYPQGFAQNAGSTAPSQAAPQTGGLSPQSPPAPPVAVQSDLVFGGGLGGLKGPKGLAFDSQGNLFVVDSQGGKVIKYDSSGKALAQVGKPGSGDGEFTEPSGIAVDGSGNVYIADTWNYRVQKFDANLQFLTKWGYSAVASTGGSQNPGGFYGPRDVAVDALDNIYVADTGNKRIQKFSPSGQFLATYGEAGRGKGQFQEPVGISISGSGEILVADTWNRRVQRFDKDFNYLGEFPVAGWVGQGLQNKPYLAVDPSGNVLVTDPESHRLLLYSNAGAFLKIYGRFGSDGNSFNLPTAIAIDAQGRVYVSDFGNGRVLRFSTLN